MGSISVIFEEYGLIIFIVIILLCFGCCIYKFCTEYTQEQINAINRVSDEREIIERIRMREINVLLYILYKDKRVLGLCFIYKPFCFINAIL